MALNPAALLAISQLVLGMGGTALKIKGAQMDAKTAEFEAQYAQRASEFNAQVALQNAKLIQESALLERARAGKVKESFLGSQRAAYAKAGVRQEGTPFQVLVETASELELDIQIDYFNAQMAAHAQRTQSSLDTAQASVARFNQIMAQQQRRLAPLTIGLQGAGQTALNVASIYNINQPKVKP